MNFYLREIKRTFVSLILLEIDDVYDIPIDGEPHECFALAHSYKTLVGIVWRKGDGMTLSGNPLESRHLGECQLITDEEARKILFESESKVEYKALKSFVKKD